MQVILTEEEWENHKQLKSSNAVFQDLITFGYISNPPIEDTCYEVCYKGEVLHATNSYIKFLTILHGILHDRTDLENFTVTKLTDEEYYSLYESSSTAKKNTVPTGQQYKIAFQPLVKLVSL